MRSTGEIMGWDGTSPRAFLKAPRWVPANRWPRFGLCVLPVKDMDKVRGDYC